MELAEKFQMKPGHMYGYYNPSYINGFEKYQGQDINFPYLQALESACREELTLNTSHTLDGQLITQDVANDNFTKIFTQTTKNVRFKFNPNMRKFGRLYKNEKPSEDQKPLLFIYYNNFMMS